MSEGHPLNALPQGHRLQEYELVRVLGVGGFGMTYLGFDHNLSKPVAIKEYLPSDIAIRTGDNSVAPQTRDFFEDFQWGLERFLGEARTLALFKHPNIIQVYRFFEAHGTAYIVMEYAEGETLSDVLKRKGRLTEAELRAILLPLLDGLEVVHEAKFLHRDIKPLNIIIRHEDDSPVLLDFGAARQAIGAKSRSVTSIVTPGYAPMEQYSSRKAQGPWTDIYALGGVCYRALTGEVPDDATDRIIDDPLIPVVKRCVGQASPRFLAAIDRALQVDDRRRPQSVAAWRTELAEEAPRTMTVKRHVTESRSRLPEPHNKPAQSKRLVVVIGVVALLAMGGLVIQKQRQELTAEKARLSAVEAAKQREAEKAGLAKEQAEKQRQQREAEKAGLAKEQAEKQRQQREAEKAGLAKEQAEKQRQQREAEKAGLAKEQAEKQRQQREAEKPRLAKEQAEKQRQQREAEKPRLAKDLYAAAVNNAYETVVTLLKQGAEINAKDQYGKTSLHHAAMNNARETVVILLKQGAAINAKDQKGKTPLHYAAQYNAYETVEALLKQRAKINAKDQKGKTPLYYATRAKALETAAFLRRYGGRE